MTSVETMWLQITGLFYFGLAIWLTSEYLRCAPEGRSLRRGVLTVVSIGVGVCGVLIDTICTQAIAHEAGHMVALAMLVTSVPVLLATITSLD